MNEIQDRIFLLVKTKNLTGAEFAIAIGVQPSNISHIMSGRNKPSLDLVMKILKKFPEVRLEWLLNGQGTMTKDYSSFNVNEEAKNDKIQVKLAQQKLEFENPPEKMAINQTIEENKVENSLDETEIVEEEMIRKKIVDDETQQIHQDRKKSDPHKIYHKKIEKIVVFYEDRTFREYNPED